MTTDWTQLNAEGLSLANQERWVDATRAFEQALVAAERTDMHSVVTSVAHDDIRARLLLNLGQCHFHTGSFEQSRRLAEQSCALRVALYGEDSLVVARTRGDLAVILAASGHTDEAMSLLERAVSAVERKRGEASAHLLPLLTNAARLLARAAPERAQPYVARLKALVFAQQQVQNAEIFLPTDIPAHSFSDVPYSSSSDDQLLRTAIAETVDLLRSTPAANVAMGHRGEAAEGVKESEGAKAAERANPVEAPLVELFHFEPPLSATTSAIQVEQNASTEAVFEGEPFAEISLDEVVTAEIPVYDVTTSEYPVGEVATGEVATSELPVDGNTSPDIHVEDDTAAAILVDDPALSEAPPDHDAPAANMVEDRAAITVAWEYEVPAPVVPLAEPRAAAPPDELDDTLFDLVEPPPPTLSELPKPASKASHAANPNPLGFQVEYGIPSQLHESLANPITPLPIDPAHEVLSQADIVATTPDNRAGMRAVGGVRRGSTQVVSMKRLWLIGASVAAFGGGIGAVLLYRYLKQIAR